MNYNYLNKLLFICRVFLGFIFVYASYEKILDPVGFSKNIHNFHITPVSVENLAALKSELDEAKAEYSPRE